MQFLQKNNVKEYPVSSVGIWTLILIFMSLFL